VINENSPISSNDALPAEVDVVIVDGGIAGVMAAWFLTASNKSFLICEKGRIAGEQSCRN
jgi:glycine/D-amino acid oxidase-like deaminating enzyme